MEATKKCQKIKNQWAAGMRAVYQGGAFCSPRSRRWCRGVGTEVALLPPSLGDAAMLHKAGTLACSPRAPSLSPP